MKSLHSNAAANAAAIKRILFFLQYKLVLCLSSTHWSNPIGCRWHDCACYHYWQNWVHEFVCVYFQVPISAALETIATPMQPASTWQQGLPVSVCQVTVAMAFIVKVNQEPFCQYLVKFHFRKKINMTLWLQNFFWVHRFLMN